MGLAFTTEVAFGFAFNVEKDPNRQSGFRPAETDVSQKHLFAQLRLEGFAALLGAGFAERLIIVGGNQKLSSNDLVPVNRAVVIRNMLIKDYGIQESKVFAVVSAPNTGGNITAIQEEVRANNAIKYAGVSNLYHLPRIAQDLLAAGLAFPLFPAEAFILLTNPDAKASMIQHFGGGPLAERVVEEIQGCAAKIQGTYKPLAK